MSQDLRDRRVLVVGAASGIGASIATAVAARGAHVACADLDLEGATAQATRISATGGRATASRLDASQPASVAEGVAAATASLGGIDDLVYAAGITTTRPALELPWQEWRDVLGVNLDGAFLTAQAAAPELLASPGGTIVFVGSQLARAATPGKAHYIASKGALEALTRALAVEWSPRGIRVVCLAPGPTRSGMLLERLGDDAGALAALEDDIPLGRLGDPDEIAGVAAFLLGPDAGFVTGTTVVADGGYQAR